MQDSEFDVTKASARLPHLAIDIVHRRARTGDAEQISITLNAVPSFQAFGEFVEAANPFLFWVRLAELAWRPWLEALEGAAPPLRVTTSRSESR